MEKHILFLISLLHISILVCGQSDTIESTYRKTIYYDSGEPHKEFWLNKDSCTYSDEMGLPNEVEYCRDGDYKEWNRNGTVAVEGKYIYKDINDTLIVKRDDNSIHDTLVYSHTKSVKTGIWNEYDTNGNKLATRRFINDRYVAVRKRFPDTTIIAAADTVHLRQGIFRYQTIEIIRSSGNKVILLHIPNELTSYSCVNIYPHRNNFLNDKVIMHHAYQWRYEVNKHCNERISPSQNPVILSTLGYGTFYLYYGIHHEAYHEVEINILNEAKNR